jgi:HAD superfamily hydrolase (TIGR01509 family)
MAVRAVLFDLGDTLIFQAHAPDPRALFPPIAARIQPLLDEWRVKLPFDLASLLEEIFRAVEIAQPARRARELEVDGAFITQGALAAHGVELSATQAEAFWHASDSGLASWGAQLYPDTLDTLARLHAAAVPAALVSNSWAKAPQMRASLATLGIADDVLPVIVTSSDVMRPKPRPEPFERALALLAVDARDALFVGDVLDVDIRGAKALGMTTVWKLNGRHEVDPEPEADYMVHDLWELFTLGILPPTSSAALPQESLTPHEDQNADRY